MTDNIDSLISQAFGIANDVLAEHAIADAAEDIYDAVEFRMEVEEHIANSNGQIPTAHELGMWLADECVFASQ
jgi:hypothetical protein